MEFCIFHEFLSRPGRSPRPRRSRNFFAQIEAAERWGLDVVWLAEIHMNPTRSLLSAPLTVAAAIAAKTQRIKIGTAVQILPLGHPLRLAEETATIDQISGGRPIFVRQPQRSSRAPTTPTASPTRRVRSASPRAWRSSSRRGPRSSASHQGRWHSFEDFTLVPRPVQQPHPEIRIAASQHDTYSAIGELGYPLFSARRATPLSELAVHMQAYRDAWHEAGQAGEPRAYLQVPIYVGATREAALADAEAGMMRFSTYRPDLIRGPMNYETVRREKGIVGTPEMVTERLMELRDTARLAGVSAEINPGSLLSHEQVMESLKLYIQEVMPNFK